MDDFNDQYDDLEEKDILIGILTELQQIRMLLQAHEGDDDGPTTYECDRCGAAVPEDKREAHARDAHKAPPDMADAIFTRT